MSNPAGHNLTPRGTPLPDKIRLLSEPDANGCWIWQASVHSNGYGLSNKGRTTVWAHRLSYEAFLGPIPEGMTVDHLCFTTACANPEHLRLLSSRDNARRQRQALSSLCGKGLHEFTPQNTLISSSGRRRCRECNNADQRMRRSKVRS